MIVRCELRFKQKLIGFKQFSDIDFDIAFEDYKTEELGLEVEDQQDYDTIMRLCALYKEQEQVAKEKNQDQFGSYDNHVSEYRGYGITPKKDFDKYGFLIDGHKVFTGFVVINLTGEYGGCNPMPGATWFQTVKEAKRGIDAFIASKGDSDLFWKLLDKKKEYEVAFDFDQVAKEIRASK